MKNYQIRRGTIRDLPFLQEMLYEAIFWNPVSQRIPRDELVELPDIAKIFQDWNEREGDISFIVIDEQKRPIGAVWSRFWTREDHTFGFVDNAIPEIGISVREEFRRRGLGTELMTEIMQYAKNSGIQQMSLSVDPHNIALQLYEKLGFRKVSESGTSWTMLKTL